jgi:hypothetical protein
MLGLLSVQWDFSDYRDVSGIKLPFVIRTSDVSSYDTVVRRFSEIKIDSSVSDNVFEFPEDLQAREMCVAGLRRSQREAQFVIVFKNPT